VFNITGQPRYIRHSAHFCTPEHISCNSLILRAASPPEQQVGRSNPPPIAGSPRCPRKRWPC